jgi:predicted amidophosphoribosyltransferase
VEKAEGDEDASEVITHSKKKNDEKVQEIGTMDWKARTDQINASVSFSGKERKVCQKCHRTFPFFKTECPDCKQKFPKTRNQNGIGGVNTECYCIAFWNRLQQEVPLFDILS